MKVFFDKYTENTKKFQETMKHLEVEADILVLEDHAFLPAGISTPYEYYISRQNQEEHTEHPLTCEKLQIPEYWEIIHTGGPTITFPIWDVKGHPYISQIRRRTRYRGWNGEWRMAGSIELIFITNTA